MSIVTVNDNASGVWAARVGRELELVGPGANRRHVIVRNPGERKEFGLPAKWLTPKPEPACGRVMEATP